MPLLESRIYALWVGKQTAKGTPNATPSKRLVQVGGDFNMPLDVGSENYSDLTKYGQISEWVNNLIGNGAPVCEATPTETAYLLWLFHGAETVTAVVGPPTAQKHSFTPQTNRGFWSTFVARKGQNVIQRLQHNDCLISQVQVEGSTANKAVRITPTVMSLDPGQVITADPAAAMPTDKVLLYTDGSGLFTVDGTAFPGQSQFTLVINEDLQPVYGDDVVPFELAQGNATATIAVTILLDAAAQQEWNTLVYGTANPTNGTKPRKAVTGLGTYSFWLKARDAAGALNGREFHLTVAGVRWAIPDFPGPAPDGGSTELALSGTLRPVAGQPLYQIDVNTNNADVAFTV